MGNVRSLGNKMDKIAVLVSECSVTCFMETSCFPCSTATVNKTIWVNTDVERSCQKKGGGIMLVF